MNNTTLELIHRALDGDLTAEEQLTLKQLLGRSPEAREMLKELQQLQSFASTEINPTEIKFSDSFADRLMDRIANEDRLAAPIIEFTPRPIDRKPILNHLSLVQRRARLALVAATFLLIALPALWYFIPRTASAPAGEVFATILPDGTEITLNSGSKVSWHPFIGSERRVTLIGEAFFDVTHDADHPFIVETFNAEIEVKGTEFNVSAWPAESSTVSKTEVALIEGAVIFRSANQPGTAVALAPGQASELTSVASLPSPPAETPVERIQSWRNGGLSLDNVTLLNALYTLERKFNLKISLQPNVLTSQKVSYWQSSPANAEQVLEALCFTLNLRFRETAEGYQILPANEP